jgi:hypothetical protein
MKNWTGNKKSIYSTLGAGGSHSNYERVDQYYYATHPSAIDDLFKVERFSNAIWEPACGEGHLSKQMEEWGKDVFSTDLTNRAYGNDFFDFLKTNIKWSGDIITNPPYRYAKEFVEKSMEIIVNGKVAMFLKLTFLESQKRMELFEKYPPKRIWVYSFRQRVARNGEEKMFNKSSAACYAWFIWEKGFSGDPVIKWIKK